MNRLSRGVLLAGMLAGCAHENLPQTETPQKQKVEAASPRVEAQEGTRSQIMAALCEEKTATVRNILDAMEFHRTPDAVMVHCVPSSLESLQRASTEMQKVCSDRRVYPIPHNGADSSFALEVAGLNMERSEKVLGAMGDADEVVAFCQDQAQKEDLD